MDRNFAGLILVLFNILITSASCKKKGDDILPDPAGKVTVVLPTLSTGTVSALEASSFTYTGMLTGAGNGKVTSRGVCFSKAPNPTITNTKREANTVSTSGEFGVNVSGLSPSTIYFVRGFVTNEAGTAYADQIEVKTPSGLSLRVEPMFIVGSTLASVDATVINAAGSSIIEKGVCWSTAPNPLPAENKISMGSGAGSFRAGLKNLSEKTTYYLRAYAVSPEGTSFSDEISFRTIPKGNLTYTFNKSANPTAEEAAAYARLQVAIDSAVWYVNNYTSVSKHVWINYSPGTPTADANVDGWMRFGSNAGFQNIRTMMHELNHTFGTGTSWWWPTVVQNGLYKSARANSILKLITGDANAVLHGDSQHWWPFGLNQNSEVSSSWDYVWNCLIIEGMRRDGLPSCGPLNY